MTLFATVKFLHVLLAIVAVGSNASYGVWLARVVDQPAPVQLHVLRGIKTLDDRLANPAYVLLAVTGLTMVFLGDLGLGTFWLGGGIVLWVVAVMLGFFVYTPMFRSQIRALETSGPDSSDYRTAASNSRSLGIVIAAIVVAIVFLMVTQPTL